MAISYVKKKIKLRINGNVEERYVAKIQYTGHVDEDNIAEHISNATTASASEVGMYIRELEYYISRRLAEGYIVRLDHLGTFYPTIHAKAQLSAADVDYRTITRKGVLFRPSADFKAVLDEAPLKLANKKVIKAIDHRKKNTNEK